MHRILRLLSNKRAESLKAEADRLRARKALEATGMAESEFEALLADERLPHRVKAKVMSRMPEPEELRSVGFPSPARAAAAFGLLTLLLVGLGWAAPRFRSAYPTDGLSGGLVEPASLNATCQLGGGRCRVSADDAVRTLVQLESLELQK